MSTLYSMRKSYAVNHFHCGCHVVEAKPGIVDGDDSIFCSLSQEEGCQYAPLILNFSLIEMDR